jgi:hypothetical protein
MLEFNSADVSDGGDAGARGSENHDKYGEGGACVGSGGGGEVDARFSFGGGFGDSPRPSDRRRRDGAGARCSDGECGGDGAGGDGGVGGAYIDGGGGAAGEERCGGGSAVLVSVSDGGESEGAGERDYGGQGECECGYVLSGFCSLRSGYGPVVSSACLLVVALLCDPIFVYFIRHGVESANGVDFSQVFEVLAEVASELAQVSSASTGEGALREA